MPNLVISDFLDDISFTPVSQIFLKKTKKKMDTFQQIICFKAPPDDEKTNMNENYVKKLILKDGFEYDPESDKFYCWVVWHQMNEAIEYKYREPIEIWWQNSDASVWNEIKKYLDSLPDRVSSKICSNIHGLLPDAERHKNINVYPGSICWIARTNTYFEVQTTSSKVEKITPSYVIKHINKKKDSVCKAITIEKVGDNIIKRYICDETVVLASGSFTNCYASTGSAYANKKNNTREVCLCDIDFRFIFYIGIFCSILTFFDFF